MKNDDHQVGRILSRRETLILLGGAGIAMLLGCSSEQSKQPTNSNLPCVVSPEQTEGPYFVDEMLNRSDIRSDPSNGTVKDGVPLQLTLNVSQISGDTCIPVAGATMDIWHCDALGIYSDVKSSYEAIK
jgi:protocatechuate 3,4-dioxygenase beta subunit